MGLPHGERAFGLQRPADQPAIRVAGQEACVAAHDLDAVDVGIVAAKDVAWLGGVTLRLTMLLRDVNGHAIRRSVVVIWRTRIKAAGG